MPTNYCWKYIRDKIDLNQDFVASRIPKGQLPPGGTLLMAAHAITVTEKIDLRGYHLVVLADHFDGNAGQINVSGWDAGGEGVNGGSATNVVIACHDLAGIQVNSCGGCGSRGKDGADGFDETEPGINGHPGKPGQNGGNGGNGGDLRVYWVESMSQGTQPNITALLDGGRGGAGGQGGQGGAGGPGGPNGHPPAGHPGANGQDGKGGNRGKTGQLHQNHVTQADYWSKVRELAVPEWTAYRLRVGEYHYRSFCPSDEDSTSLCQLARDEFDAVLALDPGNARASSYKCRLQNHQNILGLEWDFDVVPDYHYYNDTYAEYAPMVTAIYTADWQLLEPSIGLAAARDCLTTEKYNLTNLKPAMKSECVAADTANTAATKDAERAAERLNENIQRLQDCQNAQIRFLDIVISVGTIVAAVASLASGGGTLIAALPAIVAFGDALTSGEIDLFNLTQEQKAQLKEGAEGLAGLAKAAGAIVSFTKVAQELAQASADSPECLALVRQCVESAHQKMIADLRQIQSAALLDAATIRYNQAEAALAAYDQLIAQLTLEILRSRELVLSLFQDVHKCIDSLMTLAFEVVRAVAIYTIDDDLPLLHFHYGYLKPDTEQDFVEGFVDDVIAMMADLNQSWTLCTEQMQSYALGYTSYLGSGNFQRSFADFVVTNPALISQCRQEHSLTFEVSRDSLPSDHCEARVSALSVALDGVEVDPIVEQITCELEHSGRCEYTKRSGEFVTMWLRPRPTTVNLAGQAQSKLYTGCIPSTATPIKDGFPCWGRSVATTWRLDIDREAEVIVNGVKQYYPVDLSALSSIRIRIEYGYFPN